MIKPKIRLYVRADYAAGQLIPLDEAQSHYLSHVMRARAGDSIGIFNGADGEWRAEISAIQKKSVTLQLREKLCPQKNTPDLWLAFAPIKHKTDIVTEKAVELGVSRLLPVVTRHAVVRSVNAEKLGAHAVEAAEQCGRHDIPAIEPFCDLASLLAAWPKNRTLLWADESGGGAALKALLPPMPRGNYGLLVGPEGGFSADERQMLALSAFARAISLGPRILRADTAAVAALACIQAWLGDWDETPPFGAAV